MLFSGIAAIPTGNSKFKLLIVLITVPTKLVHGIFNDGDRNYEPGTFIRYAVGSSHVPQSKTGCTLFVFYANWN